MASVRCSERGEQAFWHVLLPFLTFLSWYCLGAREQAVWCIRQALVTITCIHWSYVHSYRAGARGCGVASHVCLTVGTVSVCVLTQTQHSRAVLLQICHALLTLTSTLNHTPSHAQTVFWPVCSILISHTGTQNEPPIREAGRFSADFGWEQ